MNQPIPDIENGDQTPRAVATAWFSRLRSGQMADADELGLAQWLEADPAHREAYRAVRLAWADLGSVRAHPSVMTMREELALDNRRRNRDMALRTLAASFIAGVVLLAGGAAWQWEVRPRPLTDQTFATAFGQHRTVKLPDGSQLTLNTDTVVRTRADGSRRLVYLDKGQAFFQVAHDARHPFVVSAGGRTVTALGTAFDVRVDRGAFKVTLVEGKVRVDGLASRAGSPQRQGGAPVVQATEMTAGTELVAPANEEWRVTAANTVSETSWTTGQLMFDDEPLRDVVAELNRYSHRRIIVPDPALQNATISGNFKPGDVDGFVYALQEFGVARGVVTEGNVVELKPFR